MVEITYDPSILFDKVLPSFYGDFLTPDTRAVFSTIYTALLRTVDADMAKALAFDDSKSVKTIEPFSFQPLSYVNGKNWEVEKTDHSHYETIVDYPSLSDLGFGIIRIKDYNLEQIALEVNHILIPTNCYSYNYGVWTEGAEIFRGTVIKIDDTKIREFYDTLPDGFANASASWTDLDNPTPVDLPYDLTTVHVIANHTIQIATVISDGDLTDFALSDDLDVDNIKVYIDSVPLFDIVSISEETDYYFMLDGGPALAAITDGIVAAVLDVDGDEQTYLQYIDDDGLIKISKPTSTTTIVTLWLVLNQDITQQATIYNNSIKLGDVFKYGNLNVLTEEGIVSKNIGGPTRILPVSSSTIQGVTYYGVDLLKPIISTRAKNIVDANGVIKKTRGFSLNTSAVPGIVLRIEAPIVTDHTHKIFEYTLPATKTKVPIPDIAVGTGYYATVLIDGVESHANTTTVTDGVGVSMLPAAYDRQVRVYYTSTEVDKHIHKRYTIDRSDIVDSYIILPEAVEGIERTNIAGLFYSSEPKLLSPTVAQLPTATPDYEVVIMATRPAYKYNILIEDVNEPDFNFTSRLISAEFISPGITNNEYSTTDFTLTAESKGVRLACNINPTDLWLHNTQWDEKLLQKRWGILFNTVQPSSQDYANLLKSLVIGSRTALTPDALESFLSIILGSAYTSNLGIVTQVSKDSVVASYHNGTTETLPLIPNTPVRKIEKKTVEAFTAVNKLATVYDNEALLALPWLHGFAAAAQTKNIGYSRLDDWSRKLFVGVPSDLDETRGILTDNRAHFTAYGIKVGDLVRVIMGTGVPYLTVTNKTPSRYARVLQVVSDKVLLISFITPLQEPIICDDYIQYGEGEYGSGPFGSCIGEDSGLPVLGASYGEGGYGETPYGGYSDSVELTPVGYIAYVREKNLLDDGSRLDTFLELPLSSKRIIAQNMFAIELPWKDYSAQQLNNIHTFLGVVTASAKTGVVFIRAFAYENSPLTDTFNASFTDDQVGLEYMANTMAVEFSPMFDDGTPISPDSVLANIGLRALVQPIAGMANSSESTSTGQIWASVDSSLLSNDTIWNETYSVNRGLESLLLKAVSTGWTTEGVTQSQKAKAWRIDNDGVLTISDTSLTNRQKFTPTTITLDELDTVTFTFWINLLSGVSTTRTLLEWDTLTINCAVDGSNDFVVEIKDGATTMYSTTETSSTGTNTHVTVTIQNTGTGFLAIKTHVNAVEETTLFAATDLLLSGPISLGNLSDLSKPLSGDLTQFTLSFADIDQETVDTLYAATDVIIPIGIEDGLPRTRAGSTIIYQPHIPYFGSYAIDYSGEAFDAVISGDVTLVTGDLDTTTATVGTQVQVLGQYITQQGELIKQNTSLGLTDLVHPDGINYETYKVHVIGNEPGDVAFGAVVATLQSDGVWYVTSDDDLQVASLGLDETTLYTGFVS